MNLNHKIMKHKITKRNAEEVLELASIEKLITGLLIDMSGSMADHYSYLDCLFRKIRKRLYENPDAVAKIEIFTGKFGTDAEVIDDFTPLSAWEADKPLGGNMGATNMAAGLDLMFKSIKKRLEFYRHEVKRRCYSPIILVLTDGEYTCPKEEMDRVIAKYDSYCRSSGKRKIRIWGATMDTIAAEQMSSYCDKTFILKDYKGFTDAILTYANAASIMSSSQLSNDPITGDEIINPIDDIVIEEGIQEIRSRKTLAGNVLND